MQRRDRDPGGLSPRERDLIELLRQGRNDIEIAERLGISPASAAYQISQLMRKLGAASRADAVRLAALPPGERYIQAPAAGDTMPSVWRLVRPRLTPLRALIGVMALAVAGLYAWGLIFSNDGNEARTVAVRWLQVDPPAANLTEPERPFQSLVGNGVEDMWRVFIVEGSGASRLLLESRRALLGGSWSGDGSRLNLTFSSQTRAGQSIFGLMSVNVTTGEVESERLFSTRATGFAAHRERVALVDTAPDRRGQALYIIEANGTSMRLDASWDRVQPYSWSADGRKLLVEALVSRRDGPPQEVYFILEPGVERAVRLGEFELPPSWSPDGRLLAGYNGGHLIIINTDGREEQNIDLRRGPANILSPELFLSSRMWSEDGRYLGFAGAVIDTSNGRLLAQPEASFTFTTASPDGRFVVAASNAAACRDPATNPRQTPGVANRLVLRQDGEDSVLLDCPQGFHVFLGWLTPASMLVRSGVCVGDCSSMVFNLSLVSLPEGRVTRLGQSQAAVSSLISADKQRILVGGNDLKIYGPDGRILRSLSIIGPQVTSLAWAPDGESFMYVAGPPVRSADQARP